MLHTIHVQDAISSNDLLLCEGAAPVLFEETHHLILARPLHVLVLGVVHQAAGDAGKVGLELEQAQWQDPLVGRAGREEAGNLGTSRSHLERKVKVLVFTFLTAWEMAALIWTTLAHRS